MEEAGIEYEVMDGVAKITLNRPARRNALSVAGCNRLFELWDEVDADPRVKTVILTAAPCGTFCAGMDLKEAADIKQAQGVDVLTLIRDPFHQRMRSVTKPIIAAMTGHFSAGGMMLSLNSDIRIGLANTRGGITEAKVGRGSPWAVPLLWMMPQPMLMEMVLTGETVEIDRLQAVGFVNYVEADVGAVMARAEKLATTIRDNAPLSVMAAKKSMMTAVSLGCDAGVAEAASIHRSVYESDDAQEGMLAFKEGRKPRWSGR